MDQIYIRSDPISDFKWVYSNIFEQQYQHIIYQYQDYHCWQYKFNYDGHTKILKYIAQHIREVKKPTRNNQLERNRNYFAPLSCSYRPDFFNGIWLVGFSP